MPASDKGGNEELSARLWAIADLITPMAVRVAATLRLADHVAAGAESVAALARRTGSDPDGLRRLVDHLVRIGVLRRDAEENLVLGELGELLREGHPDDWRGALDIEGAVGRADLSALRLLDAVRTGQPAYPLLYGRGFWEDLAADPALGESFDAFMASRLRVEAPRIAAGYDWDALTHVVDVGGGTGALLAAILGAHPRLRGTLVELAGPAQAAARTFAQAGVAERCEIVAGSFFEPLPPGADAYLLATVLYDWDDAHALEILRRCAEAAGPAGRVLLIEHCDLEDGPAAGMHTEMDLRMLALTGGRARTIGEFERLAADAGLRLRAADQVTRWRSVIELRA